jgi:hypothetical protein
MRKPFIKGHHIGRPRGSKDHTWAKVTTWFEELKLAWPDLTSNQKAHYSIELMKLLTSKLKQLPVDPQEAKLNVEDALQVLNQIKK